MNTTTNCEHCTAEVDVIDRTPALNDCTAWATIAKQHDDGCDFVVTRDFRAHIEEEDRELFLVADDERSQFIKKLSHRDFPRFVRR